MNLKKSSLAFLVLGLSLISCDEVLALTSEELNGYSLSVYEERIVGSSRLEEYLKKKGVDIKEYNAYLKKSQSYLNSNEQLWEQIENGSILMDGILFTDKKVRNEYDKALKKLGSKHLAYEFVKKNMINDPKLFINIFENGMKDVSKIRSAYEVRFDKELNEVESVFLNNLNTVKRALYIGVKGGHLISQGGLLSYDDVIDAIDKGEGYIVLDLTAKDIEKYMEFIKERTKYDKLMIPYIKMYSMFETISNEISGKYKKDIYKELSDNERLNIYNTSLNGFIFDENVAKKKVVEALISKKVLAKEDLVEDDGNLINDGYDNINPWSEINKYLKGNNSSNKVQSLSSLYSGKGVGQVSENLDSKYVYIKYKDLDINTYLRVSKDGLLESDIIMDLINILNDELKLKTVLSKKEMLTFFENKINIFKIALEKDIKFDVLSKELKTLGVELYLKDIDFNNDEDNVEIEDDLGEEIEGVNYRIDMHFKDKLIEYDLGESNKIEVEDVSEILESLNVTCVLSRDGVLVLKDGSLKVSKAFGLQDREITVDKLKSLFNDIGEKVNINVVKDID